ncbi:hypothetical protein AtDm6_1811 [Acetobacter tropicalis]|uniref:Uncharacterized protein n=1 Tax=Acetobacter tropicalis TaxID=104102 RepID=A0A094YNJ5_9PROT|nr:hypothetical protein AtDm6_1811 [Acetobacter tropicalis]
MAFMTVISTVFLQVTYYRILTCSPPPQCTKGEEALKSFL